MGAELLDPLGNLHRRGEVFFKGRGEHLGADGCLQAVGLDEEFVNLGRRLEIEPAGDQKVGEQRAAFRRRVDSHRFAKAGFGSRDVPAHRCEVGLEERGFDGLRPGAKGFQKRVGDFPFFQPPGEARIAFRIRRGEGPGGGEFFQGVHRRQILPGRDLDFGEDPQGVGIGRMTLEGFLSASAGFTRLAGGEKLGGLHHESGAPPFQIAVIDRLAPAKRGEANDRNEEHGNPNAPASEGWGFGLFRHAMDEEALSATRARDFRKKELRAFRGGATDLRIVGRGRGRY